MKEKVYSVGIDVSKKTLDICFLGKKLNVLKTFKTTNNPKGVNKIQTELKKHSLDEDAPVAMESTSSYHILSALTLKENGYKVKVFNPIMSKKFSNNTIRKCKTDKVDAMQIAQLAYFEELHDFNLTQKDFFLKKRITFRKKLKKNLQIIRQSLKQYEEDCKTFEEVLSPAIVELKNSLKKLEKSIKDLDKEICDLTSKMPMVAEVAEIRGVSEISAGIIIGLLHGKEFPSKAAIAAYAGLDVSTKQSGTSVKGRGYITKRGNPVLRQTLTQVSWGLIMHNSYFKKLREYYIFKGKHYYEIMVIIARKLLHIIYGMIKTNSRFDPAKLQIPALT